MNDQAPRAHRDRTEPDPHELAAAYAVNAVDDAERREFERHLAQCADCRAEVAGLREAGAALSALSETAAPASLRRSVLEGISRAPQVSADESATTEPPARDELAARRAARPPRKIAAWAAAGVAAAALVVGGVTWHPWSPDQSTVQLTATQQVLQAKDAQRYVEQVDGATATVVRSPSLAKAVLLTSDMPAAPQGHVYELWYFTSDGKPAKAGLMPPGSSRDAKVLLDGDAASAKGVGITVEPAGGSKQPTTKPLVTFDLT